MYQVWTKEQYQDLWALQEVGGVSEVEEIIRANFGTDIETKVTRECFYEAKVAIKFRDTDFVPKKPEPPTPEPKSEPEEVKSEADQGQSPPDNVAGNKSDGGNGRGDGGRVQKSRK